jgi:hypothetical protein
MGPGNRGGLGAIGGSLIAAVVVAVATLILVVTAGTLSRPLVSTEHVSVASAPVTQG